MAAALQINAIDRDRERVGPAKHVATRSKDPVETRKMSHRELRGSKNSSVGDLPCERMRMCNLALLHMRSGVFSNAQTGRWRRARVVQGHGWVCRNEMAQEHRASSGSKSRKSSLSEHTWRKVNLPLLPPLGLVSSVAHQTCAEGVDVCDERAV